MKTKLMIIGIIVLGLLTRLIQLNGSFWLDEAAQALESARPLSQQFEIIPDFQPPLYHLLVHFWMLGGKSESWLRLTSLIPGLLTIWLTIVLGKKLFNLRTGMIAGLLLATSQFHVFYSQELRPYSLDTLWAMVTVYFLYQIVTKEKPAYIGLILSGIVGLYTMYLFPLFLLSLAVIVLIWYRPFFKSFCLSGCVMAIALLPWLPTFFKQLGVGTGLAANQPAWSQIVSPPLAKMLPLTGIKFLLGRITVDPVPQDILILSILGLAGVWLVFQTLRSSKGKQIAVWFIIPILISFLISLKIPILDPKRVLFCLPALYLLIAAGVKQNLLSKISVVIIIGINCMSLVRYATDPNQQREPWRAAVAAIEQDAPSHSLVVFAFPEPFAPWYWYQTKSLPTLAINDPNSSTQLIQQAKVSSKIYVFDYLTDVTDPNRKIIQTLDQNYFTEVNFFQYPGIGKIHILTPIPAVASL